MNYYNEFDPKAAAWLRELIKARLIPPGDVDERSITEIKPHELAKYTQCHFFAGIGGWSLALQFAGWPADRPVGTGSCPCQPFSAAGNQLGNADARHLWPAFFRLIRECRALGQRWTDEIFGEQVESAVGHGWLDSLSADMEGEGYAVGSAVLGAHSVGAPHRRQRLYWVAIAQGQGRSGVESEREAGISERTWTGGDGAEGSVDESTEQRRKGGPQLHRENDRGQPVDGYVSCPLDNPHGARLDRQKSDTETTPRDEARLRVSCDGRPNGVAQGDTDLTGSQGRGLQPGGEPDLFETWTRGVDFIACTDGRKRLVKSGIFPLAHGFPARVGLLRGSGNAIVPQVAAQFIIAAEEARLGMLGQLSAPAVEDLDA